LKQKFKIGEHVTWNSEAGHVSGTIIKIHLRDFDYKGYTRHASKKILNMKLRAIKQTILPYIKPVHFQKNKIDYNICNIEEMQSYIL
jgi:hypothetical protein